MSPGHRVIDPVAVAQIDGLKSKIVELSKEIATARESINGITDEAESFRNQSERLTESLTNIIDATEDKNGMFKAWHNDLRKATKAGRELLGYTKPKD